jgi:hypothetical protein
MLLVLKKAKIEKVQTVAGYARTISDTNKSKETSPKPQL